MTEMTAPTPPAPPAPPKKAPGGQSGGRGGTYVAHAAGAALVSWLGGSSLNQGWGVHVPFMAAWILLLAVLVLAGHVSALVARVWHAEKIKAAPQLATYQEAARMYVNAMGPAIVNRIGPPQGQ